MRCPCAHEWYEAARGVADREEAERLRRHQGECADCRAAADELRDVAARLESLAGWTRADLSAEAAESLMRRARVHGLVGRPIKVPRARRGPRPRWVRFVYTAMAVAAAAAIVAVGLRLAAPEEIKPRGALERLVRAAHGVRSVEGLGALAPVARAAVSEELAQAEPNADQVADLLLVAYITERPRENRQAGDVNFLLGLAWDRRRPVSQAGSIGGWPMLASAAVATVVAPKSPAEGGRTLSGGFEKPPSPLAAARAHILEGRYSDALAVLPTDASAAALRAWCIQAARGPTWRTEALRALADAEGRDSGPLTRLLRADLALASQDVAEAMRQYETLAAHRDRYWFAAGYLCRYELRDPRGAGQRLMRVSDPALAGYVARQFRPELAAARESQPPPLFTEDFDSSPLGAPSDWALVKVRGGEFRIVDVPGGRALRQDELKYRGAEFLADGKDWADYTLQVDVKILQAQGEYAIGATAYRQSDHTGYVLELSPGRLRIIKQFASRREGAAKPLEPLAIEPQQAQFRLEEPPATGWWYTIKLRVQRVDVGVSVAGKVWRSDTPEPLGWQVVWTDMGQGGLGPLVGGAAGLRIDGAQVLIDNFIITRNDVSGELVATVP